MEGRPYDHIGSETLDNVLSLGTHHELNHTGFKYTGFFEKFSL